MVTISKKVEYSVIFISYLAKHGDNFISLSEIAEKKNLPYRFLGQLAISLRGAEIIEGKEGKNGGYRLQRGWKKKTVYDLLEALGENRHIVKCLAGDRLCAREAECDLRKIWKRLEESFIDQLKLIKLNQV